MAEDLATVDRERRALVATVSHELRTPLAALAARLENLADGVEPADRDALEGVLAQAQRLGTLVDRPARPVPGGRRRHRAAALRGGRRRPGGRGPRRRRPARPRRVVRRPGAGRADRHRGRRPAAPARRQPAGQRGAARPAGWRRHGDRGPRPADGWWLEVGDEGPGVPGRRTGSSRGSARSAEGTGGTGLGLAVARWVAQLHGGTIGFLAAADRPGTTVRVELPARPDPRQPTT